MCILRVLRCIKENLVVFWCIHVYFTFISRKYFVFFPSEPRPKVPSFKLKFRSSTKHDSKSFLKEKSRRSLFESGGDGTSKSSVGNTKNKQIMLVEDKSTEHKLKNYSHVEWSLTYIEEDGVLLLIFATSEGKGKLELGKTFPYGKVRNLEYEDSDSSIIFLEVESSGGIRRVQVDEGNLVPDVCHPKSLRKDMQTKNNLIVALRPYVTGEMMSTEAETPPKKSRKTKPEHKKYQKRQISNDEDLDVLEFEEEEDDEQQLEIVPPGGQISSGVLTSEQNRIRENIARTKLVRKGQLFHLPISSIQRPPIDPETGRRTLEIREPHAVHVQNLKSKMKINPHATVVPFLVMVDPEQCPTVADFKYSSSDDYTYYVIGGSHSAEARRQLVKEYPLTPFFKYAECKVYAGLTHEEAKLLAWDHNNDNDYRQKMSCIERIRFFHHEYLDALQRFGPKLNPGLRRQCLLEVGIAVDESTKSEGLRKYDSWFQLAFRTGEVWDLQDRIFGMWERKEVKGQRAKKAKVDPQVEMKTKSRKSDLFIEELAEDMKLLPWRSLQGIKDDRLLISVLSRVAAKEFSLDEMVTELQKYVKLKCFSLFLCISFDN